jgi:hypothetical protein
VPVTFVPGKPFTTVDAPTREAYDHGLFSVLDFGNAERAGLPIQWDSVGFMVPTAVQDVCLHGADPHTKTNLIECAEMYSTGFTVVSYDTSGLQKRGTVDADLAASQLEYAEQLTVEGYLLQLLDENDVTAPVVTGASPYPARQALATIESALAGRGAKGTIIMSRFLASLLSESLDIGVTTLTTKLGTPVAAIGAPFGAISPLNIYGVTGLRGVRGQVNTAAAPDKAVNNLSAFAERDYSIGFEGQAFVAVATTTL